MTQLGTPAEGRLVGAGHKELVEKLLDRLANLQRGDKGLAPIVVLESPSGSGKSEVVRELYRRLAAGQSEPAYWPPLPLGGRVQHDRKVLGPRVESFVWPAHALPDFGWWPLVCTAPNGVETELTDELAKLAHHHLAPLALAWSRDTPLWERVGRGLRAQMRDRSLDALDEAAQQALGMLLVAAGATVPALGLVLSWANAGGKALLDLRHRSQDLRSDVYFGKTQAELVQARALACAEALLAVTKPGLPTVIVLEDAHYLPESLITFLDAVTGQTDTAHPVLVVATAYNEGRAYKRYAQWVASRKESCRLEVWTVPALEDHERAELLLGRAPRTDPKTATALAARYKTPLEVCLLLDLDRFRERVARTGAVEVSLAEIGTLPRDREGLLLARWEELPASVRTAMRLAAKAVAINPAEPATIPFIARVIDAAATSIGRDGVNDGLEKAVNPYAWFTGDGGVLRFADPDLALLAAQQWPSEFGADDATKLTDAVRHHLETLLEAAGRPHNGELRDPDRETVTAAYWWLSLVGPEDHSRATLAATWLAARRAAARGLYDVALQAALENDVARQYTADAPLLQVLEASREIAIWAHLAGRDQAALPAIEYVYVTAHDARDDIGADHPFTLRARLDLITWAALESNGPDEVVDSLSTLLATASAKIGPDHEITLAVRAALADWHERADRDATKLNLIPERDQLLSDLDRVRGADHPDTVAARRAYTQDDRLADSTRVAMLRDLTAYVAGLWGPRSLDLFSLQIRLVEALRWVPDGPAEALELSNAVVEGLTRLVGPDHPETLAGRLARAYVRLDDLPELDPAAQQECWTEVDRLADDAAAALGDEHHVTRQARGLADQARGNEQSIEVGDPEALERVAFAAADLLLGDSRALADTVTSLPPPVFFGALLNLVDMAVVVHTFGQPGGPDEFLRTQRQQAQRQLDDPSESAESLAGAKAVALAAELGQAFRSGDRAALCALLYRGPGRDACTSAAVVQFGTIAGLVGAVNPADLEAFLGHLLELAAVPQDH